MLSSARSKQALFVFSASLLSSSVVLAQTKPALIFGPPAPSTIEAPYSSSLLASNTLEDPLAFSSSATPALENRSAAYFGGGYQAEGASKLRTIRPFSDLALQLKFGSAGAGFDLATPLTQHLNLRGGGSFFSYQASLVQDGLHIDGNISFANAALSLDYFPFHSGFRISPGVTFYNDTNLVANLSVPGGQSFSLGDNDATSDPSDPVHGKATLKFGHMVAPRITMGWGNMIPRKGNQHWSVPFEVGVQFASRPKIHLEASGQSCASQTEPDGSVDYGCGPVDQTDLLKEQSDLQQDINALRFFPVLSIGVSYRFGLSGR